MRARRQKSSTVLNNASCITKPTDLLTKQEKESTPIAECSKNSDENVQEKQLARPVRQRRMTKKLEESYVSNSRSKQVVEKTPHPPPKRQKRQEKAKTDLVITKPTSNLILQQIKAEPESDENNEFTEEDYAALAQKLLKTLNESRNASEHFMQRKEIFDDNDETPQLKIKEEPLDEEIDSPIAAQPTDTISQTKTSKKKRKSSSKASLQLKKPLLNAKQNLKNLSAPRSIFSDPRLRTRRNNFILPKPEMPTKIDYQIEQNQMRSMLGALIHGTIEIDFKRQKLQNSFRTVQASILKHTPGLLPIFIDIMKETQTNMQNYGYYDRKVPQKSGEDRLMKMLMDLESLRLNVKKETVNEKQIKEEPIDTS